MISRPMTTAALFGLAATALAACAPPSLVAPAGPRSYQLGYVDGCNAGYNVSGSPLFALDRLETAAPPSLEEPYRSGWQRGYVTCRRSFDRQQKVLYTIFGPS